MIKIITKILQKLQKRQEAMAFIPTPFDSLPEPFVEVEKFIEKEFYLLMYQMINNPPTFLTLPTYKASFISFILTFSVSTIPSHTLDKERENILALKEYFYRTLVLNCIQKMSMHLKVIFYRHYNINSFPSIQIIRTERFQSMLERFQFLLKTKPSLYKKIERGLNKFIIDVQLEEDKELSDYILQWARMKFDFIGAEITLLRNQYINQDIRLDKLKKIPMDYWGSYNIFKSDIKRDQLDEEMRILIGTIESQYFLTRLKTLFNK